MFLLKKLLNQIEDLAQIEGFDEAIGEELRNRAINFSQAQEESFKLKRQELGVSDLADLDGITPRLMVILEKIK